MNELNKNLSDIFDVTPIEEVKLDEIINASQFNGITHPKINSSLINYYRDGNDYIKYHADDELVFGSNPTVSMLTFGCERTLKFRRNNKCKK